MTRIKRRQFLQFAGSTLATLGLSQLDISCYAFNLLVETAGEQGGSRSGGRI